MPQWSDAWSLLNPDGQLELRQGQATLADSVFGSIENKTTLVAEAPTGTGKSLAYLVPLIYAARDNKQRSVVSTETIALLDQLIDKDLPYLKNIFGNFKFFGLKGRNWYLCTNRGGRSNPLVLRIMNRIGGNGERRDAEKVVGKLDDETWGQICGDAEYCAQNKCSPETCFSTRARSKAADVDIIVTSHAMLRTNAEMVGRSGSSIFGDIDNVVIDEAHSLETVLIDGWSLAFTPYELDQKFGSINKALAAASDPSIAASVENAEKLTVNSIECITHFMDLLTDTSSIDEWKRETMSLSQKYLSGGISSELSIALADYEESTPDQLQRASQMYTRISKYFLDEAERVDRGAGKIRKGATAAGYLASMLALVSMGIQTRNGIIDAYGSSYIMLSDGWLSRDVLGRREKSIRLRAVPLDVSGASRANIWSQSKSVIVLSATLRDLTDSSFRYVKRSLGLDKEAVELVVDTSFNYEAQQLVYLTDQRYEREQIIGAQYSLQEVRDIIDSSDGRALVLFTARSELDDAAEQLQSDRSFDHQILVQEKKSDKQELIERFKKDKHSVLLGTKSFFTGVDFPGEMCSVVVVCKYPLPQYNALTQARMQYWRERGFPTWYEREGLQVFAQAAGRLIRTNQDRGVVAVLDHRAVQPGQKIERTMKSAIPKLYGNAQVTYSVEDISTWLAATNSGSI